MNVLNIEFVTLMFQYCARNHILKKNPTLAPICAIIHSDNESRGKEHGCLFVLPDDSCVGNVCSHILKTV